MEPHLIVGPSPFGGWIGYCSTHGPMLFAWSNHDMAALDLVGHATHHHPPLTGHNT